MHVQLTYQQPICRTLVLTFCPTKGGKIRNVMTHKVMWVIQKTGYAFMQRLTVPVRQLTNNRMLYIS